MSASRSQRQRLFSRTTEDRQLYDDCGLGILTAAARGHGPSSAELTPARESMAAVSEVPLEAVRRPRFCAAAVESRAPAGAANHGAVNDGRATVSRVRFARPPSGAHAARCDWRAAVVEIFAADPRTAERKLRTVQGRWQIVRARSRPGQNLYKGWPPPCTRNPSATVPHPVRPSVGRDFQEAVAAHAQNTVTVADWTKRRRVVIVWNVYLHFSRGFVVVIVVERTGVDRACVA